MSTRYPNDVTLRDGMEPGPDPGCVYRTVEIPGADSHDGTFSIEVSLRWTCPRCTGPRGLPFPGHFLRRFSSPRRRSMAKPVRAR